MSSSATRPTPPAGTTVDSRRQIEALTGLRFLAALHVVFFHFGGPIFEHAPQVVQNLAGSGYCGVSLFFILSGFVLTYTYAGRTEATDQRAFWWARFARIYPVYLLGFLLAAPHIILTLRGGGGSVIEAAGYGVAALALLQGWLPAGATYWNVPAWSLSCEAFFYALFPWLTNRFTRRLKRGRELPAMAVLWAVGMLLPLAYLVGNPDGLPSAAHPPFPGTLLNLLKYSPLTRLPEFVMGCALGRLYLNDVSAGWQRPGAKLAAWGCGGALLVMLLSGWLPYPLVHNGLAAPFYALLIYGLAHGGGRIGALLARRPLVLLGEASYAIYILQIDLHEWIMRLLRLISRAAEHSPLISFLFYLAVFLPVCTGVYLYYERPLRSRIRRWAAQRHSATAA